MARRSSSSSIVFLQVAVGAFFLLLGLLGIVNYNSSVSRFGREMVRIFGGRSDALNLIVAILSLAAGIILLLGLFLRIDSRVMYAAALAVFIYWALRILYVFFFNNIFEPDFLVWLEQLSIDVVVLASAWLIARMYS